MSSSDRPDVKRAELSIPPKYNVAIVEAVMLEIAAELHPEHLSAGELSLKIIDDANDSREVETAAQAIRGLREFGLFKVRGDKIVELTPAALRACTLFTVSFGVLDAGPEPAQATS